jgi:hypothetical protein
MRRMTLTLAPAALVAVLAAPVASANPQSVGSQVSNCAQTMLPSTTAPTVTCSCADGSMTFATFGAMVQAMLAAR